MWVEVIVCNIGVVFLRQCTSNKIIESQAVTKACEWHNYTWRGPAGGSTPTAESLWDNCNIRRTGISLATVLLQYSKQDNW